MIRTKLVGLPEPDSSSKEYQYNEYWYSLKNKRNKKIAELKIVDYGAPFIEFEYFGYRSSLKEFNLVVQFLNESLRLLQIDYDFKNINHRYEVVVIRGTVNLNSYLFLKLINTIQEITKEMS